MAAGNAGAQVSWHTDRVRAGFPAAAVARQCSAAAAGAAAAGGTAAGAWWLADLSLIHI